MPPFSLIVDGEETVVPGKFAGGLEDGSPVRIFAGRDLAHRDRIFNHLASGGIAVVSGQRVSLAVLLAYVLRHWLDLAGSGAKRKEQDAQGVLTRLMVLARNETCEGLKPLVRIPHLSEFCGEVSLAANQQFLIPLIALRSLEDALDETWPVDALDTWMVAGVDVIPPRSQETVALFQEAIAMQVKRLPANPQILDMGCGSGVLALVAAITLNPLQPKVTATDILPEATASTRLNAESFADEDLIEPDAVNVLSAGDLFGTVGDERYDLIIFNAPWVVAPVGSRSDISLNDPKQKTIRRFLEEVPRHLKQEGRVVLGYADNSGQRAVERVLELAEKAGLSVLKERSVRVQTHRKKRKWQRIYVWEMGRNAD